MLENPPAGVHELTREESLALLPTVPVGRLVFTERALPAVVPVNFLVDRGRIVLKTGATSSLSAAVRGSVVAFEVDQIDPQGRQGWSVVVTGRASEIQDAFELERLRDLPLVPWVGGQLDHVIVISIELVNGRRIGGRPWTVTRRETHAVVRDLVPGGMRSPQASGAVHLSSVPPPGPGTTSKTPPT